MELMLLAGALLLLAPCTRSQGLPQLQSYAQDLAEQRIFAGMVHVDQGGSTVFSKGFGQANWELGVPMRNDHRYPIGSNTKLFTAVAVWQLHRAGKLSVYEPVSKFINHTAVGLDGPWCPKVVNASQSAPCQPPTLSQLLQMSGGVIGFDNCDYRSDAWQQNYCWGNPGYDAVSSISGVADALLLQGGGISITDYLVKFGVLKLPLEFAPGTAYHYSNPGYSIAGYVIEQVSGMPLADYYRINIFGKYNLTSTEYDVTNGQLGLHKGQLPYPAYISYLMPGAAGQVAAAAGDVSVDDFVAAAGDKAYWGGDIRNGSASALQSALAADSSPANATSDTGAVYEAFVAKYPGPSNADWVVGNAAGAIVSTPQDMTKWFRALLVDSGHLGLGKELLKEFLNMSIAVPRMPTYKNTKGENVTLEFAQGIIVMKALNHPRGLGVSHVYYLGSLGGYLATIYMSLDPVDPGKDVFVNALTATVLPSKATWPAAAQNLKGRQCAQQISAGTNTTTGSNNAAVSNAAGGRRLNKFVAAAAPNNTSGSSAAGAAVAPSNVPLLLCEMQNMVPSATATTSDVLARRAVRELTGQEWFGINE